MKMRQSTTVAKILLSFKDLKKTSVSPEVICCWDKLRKYIDQNDEKKIHTRSSISVYLLLGIDLSEYCLL